MKKLFLTLLSIMMLFSVTQAVTLTLVQPQGTVQMTRPAGSTITFKDLTSGIRWWKVLSGGVEVIDGGFTMPNNNVTVQAMYTGNLITVIQSNGGTISTGSVGVDVGGSRTFTITPNSGYKIATVLVDGVSKTVTDETGMDYTFTNVTAPHTITATFVSASSEAIAIYSETDNSLTFLRTVEEIEVGDTYNGKAVTAVYTGIETTSYSDSNLPPWYDDRSSITNVTFEDEILPISTAFWFDGCSNLTEINNISNLNTENVTNMRNMFNECSSLRSLDVSGFVTNNVTNMGLMFRGCSGVTELDVSNFNTNSVESMSSMFENCSSLTNLDVSGFDVSSVMYINVMFSGCSSLTSLDVDEFDTRNVKRLDSMFRGCSSLSSLDVSGFNTENVTNMEFMFDGCSSLSSLDVSGFVTNNVTDMGFMFRGCSGVTELDVSGFVTNNVTNMFSMFDGCSSLTSLNVNGFNTANVTTMREMFDGCAGITELDVSGFVTSNVTNMSYMFRGCSGVTELDVSGFITTNVTDMTSMFSDMTKLQQITLGENFSFTGDGSTSCTLPTPSSTYITGADGNWYNTAGTAFTPANVPSNVEDTYYAIAYTITATAGTGGTITPATKKVIPGGSATFTITQNDGYVLSSLNVDGNTISAQDSYTFTDVVSNHTISATFERQGCNSPVLAEGLTPVNWSGSTWVATDEANWDYNYNSVAEATHSTVAGNGDGKWANAQTSDGSLYVWIPRYTYKITSGEHSNGNSWNSLDSPGTNKIEIKFSRGTIDDTSDSYKKHPAFTFGSDELTGFWVAKYEASRNNATSDSQGTGTKPASKPEVQPWVGLSVSDMFDYAYNLNRNLESHLIKNLEWGAVAYLTNAIGRIPYINNHYASREYGLPVTGYAGGSQNATKATGNTNTYLWNTVQGVKASTTHNVYGIYDMSGGAFEYVAAYLNNGDSNLSSYASNLVSSYNTYGSKYVDVYPIGTSDTQENNYAAWNSITGDAIYETSSTGTTSTNAWDGDHSACSLEGYPGLSRGNGYDDGTKTGIFAFRAHNCMGNGCYYDGFRIVLVP